MMQPDGHQKQTTRKREVPDRVENIVDCCWKMVVVVVDEVVDEVVEVEMVEVEIVVVVVVVVIVKHFDHLQPC